MTALFFTAGLLAGVFILTLAAKFMFSNLPLE